MRREVLPMKTLLATLCAVAVGGFGCSDTGKDGDITGGAGGTPATGSGGTGVTGGKSSTGGTGAQPGTGGSSAQTGGTTGTGGAGTGGSGAGAGGTVTAGAGGGGSGSGGAGMAGSPTAGTGAGGAHDGGSANGGTGTSGAGAGGAPAGGNGNGGKAGRAGSAGSGGSGGGTPGTCTASQSAGKSVSGTGPHKVVIETNSASGIKCGTIFRPEDLGGTEKYPIFVWGEGGCSQNGLSNQAAMGEIASWGYFVVADGTPGSGACTGGQDGKALLDYITWAIAENDKSCSAYYQSLEPTKIAADGFSCGGLMSENVSGDPRFTAIGITSSGLMGSNDALYDKIHTPFKIMNGGSSDVAYENGLNDYEEISSRDKPIIYFSKTSAGHGGDLGQGRGDFNLVNLAWLNWQLKGDEGATGKAFLIGSTCKFCMDSGWVFKSTGL